MESKPTVVDIFGGLKNIVDSQASIIKEIPHLNIKKHVKKDFIRYFEQSSVISDIVILNLSEHAIGELNCLQNANLRDKSIVVIGDKNNIDLLRGAISTNVYEFLSQDDDQHELIKVINQIILNNTANYQSKRERKLNVVINSKGGSGASFIASNLSYLLSKDPMSNVALLDMDLQFGSIGLNFDVDPKYTLTEVLNSITDIDHVSLAGYLVNFSNSLHLLLPSPQEIVLPGEITPQAIKSLLYTLQRSHNQVVIDLPRIIDPIATTVFEKADHITIVVQQTLAQFRDGRRLVNILNKDLDISLDKIIIVINRYDPNNNLKKSDMVDIVNHNNVFTIANDFKAVASASNLGELYCHSLPKSKIAKDLLPLANFLGGIKEEKNKSWISRLIKSR